MSTGGVASKEKVFGPTALATPANALTMARLVASPLFALAVVSMGPASWTLLALWAVLAGSDGLDGHLARRQGSTRSGAFLDPLADKFLVIGALCALVAASVVTWLPVALIFGREAAMSAFRVHAGRRGVSIPARPLAKVKTFVQDIAVAMALFPPIGAHHDALVRAMLWVAVALTLYTGGEYLIDGRKLLRVRARGGCDGVRAEIVAVGTELLLGQIVDTNSTWIAEQLAGCGIDCLFQTRVGDNLNRITEALEIALERSDAVITCGGLGPTQDDITREAIAKVMGVELRRDPALLEVVRGIFAARGREMSPSNARQADLPEGAAPIPQTRGTAPGLICPVGEKVVYALPGVPDELREMVARAVLPDLRARSGDLAVIVSRTLRTWGYGESMLAEIVTPRLEVLDAAGEGAPTIAFLASGIEGIKLRLTVKAPDAERAAKVLDAEEAALRQILGDIVFGVDDETMEFAVGEMLVARGLTLAVAESFTGGLIAARAIELPGASRWMRGAVVAYASDVKRDLLDVPDGPVVTAAAAAAMADGVRRRLGADVGLATTGVAGPDPQEGHPPGTAFVGVALPGGPGEGVALSLSGPRERVRQIGTISALDELRRRLAARP